MFNGRREEAAPGDMDEEDYQRVEREREMKEKRRKSIKTGEGGQGDAWRDHVKHIHSIRKHIKTAKKKLDHK